MPRREVQQNRQRHRDHEKPQPIDRHDELCGKLERMCWQPRREKQRVRAVLERRGRLQDREESEGGDRSSQGRCGPQPAHDELVYKHAEEREARDRRDGCRPVAPPLVRGQLVEDVRARHCHRALREVQDTGASVDQHDSLRDERVDCARPESQDGELEDVVHFLASSLRGAREALAATLPDCARSSVASHAPRLRIGGSRHVCSMGDS
jgi:hypothetical protein